MRASTVLLALAVVVACGGEDASEPQSSAAEVTFYDDVAPILEAHCLECHRDGGVAPFRLDTYASARDRASSIRLATAERRMPPWHVTSDGSCGEFADSRALSAAEIATLGEWAEHGAPEGDARALELPSVVTLESATDYALPQFAPEVVGGPLAEHDESRCFAFDSGVEETAFITGYEVRPGVPALVHHVIGFVVDPEAPASDGSGLTNAEKIAALDAESPDRAGWPCFSMAGEGVGIESVPVTWAPGQTVVSYPNQSGVPLAPNRKIVVQVHYNLFDRSLEGSVDQTTVRLRLAPVVENVAIFTLYDPLLQSLTATPVELPAGSASVPFEWQISAAELGLPDIPELELYGVLAHMHGLGHKFRLGVRGPDGRDAACAADIQDFDVHWQRLYFYSTPYAVDAATRFEVTCDFDTSSRVEPVGPGWSADKEMCLGILFFTAPLAALAAR